MKRFIEALSLTAALVLFSASCSASGVDSLVGEYALEQGGRAEVKISKDGNRFVVSVRKGDGWSRPDTLVICVETDYAQLFGSGWRQIEPVGLRATNGPFGIFRVKKGTTAPGHTFKTGYFLFFVGGGDVYKL